MGGVTGALAGSSSLMRALSLPTSAWRGPSASTRAPSTNCAPTR